MPPVDALASRSLALDDLARHVMVPGYLAEFADSMRHPDVGTPSAHTRALTGDGLRQTLMRDLRMSEAYYVSPDMLALATAAAETLPDDATVERQTPMTEFGWLWFGSPLTVLDVRGKVLRFCAVSWSPWRDGAAITWWTDKYDDVDSVNVMQRHRFSAADLARLPRYLPGHVDWVQFGAPLPRSISFGRSFLVPPEVDVVVAQTEHGVSWLFPEGMTPDEMTPRHVVDPAVGALTVVWRLMRQTIADVRYDDARTPKHLRRMIARQNTTDRVSVIALRHREYRGNGGREVQWTHRWLVRGYWRRQWYGSGAERWQDWIYVHPYIKGPDSAPLLVRERVNALLR